MRNLLHAELSRMFQSKAFLFALLAELLCCMIVVSLLDIMYLVVAGVFCVYPVIGMAGTLFRVPVGHMLIWVIVGLLARAAWAAVVKLTATVLGSKAAASIAALLLVAAAAGFCAHGFHELEYLVRNTAAVNREGRMAFWRLALDLLPTGQYIQVSRLDTPNLWRMPLLSLSVIGLSTGAGMLLFRRKDLK